MQAGSVLLITHDDFLWRHWRELSSKGWMPARGHSLEDLARWRDQGRGVALLDAGMPQLPEWGDQVWAQHTQGVNVVVGTMRPGDDEGKAALASGARGYVHAYSPIDALDTVLKTVQAGGVWMGPTLLARLLRQIDQNLPRQKDWAEGLTQREREVAERAAIGHSNQAIAESLDITERTVRAHLSAVFQKLGVNDRLLLALKVHGIS